MTRSHNLLSQVAPRIARARKQLTVRPVPRADRLARELKDRRG